MEFKGGNRDPVIEETALEVGIDLGVLQGPPYGRFNFQIEFGLGHGGSGKQAQKLEVGQLSRQIQFHDSGPQLSGSVYPDSGHINIERIQPGGQFPETMIQQGIDIRGGGTGDHSPFHPGI